MQRLVTIFLHNHHENAHEDGRVGCIVRDHLTDELAEGWRIVSVTALNGGMGGNESGVARGWLAVLLER